MMHTASNHGGFSLGWEFVTAVQRVRLAIKYRNSPTLVLSQQTNICPVALVSPAIQ